jgi:hypothetical protein
LLLGPEEQAAQYDGYQQLEDGSTPVIAPAGNAICSNMSMNCATAGTYDENAQEKRKIKGSMW